MALINTIDYYNAHAHDFAESTRSIEFHELEDYFLSFLKPDSAILDFGCGSGRDSKYFLEHGYSVTATDGSEELCRLASGYTGLSVRCQSFEALTDINSYDGIWACASILHVSKAKLPDIFMKMSDALKQNGYIYTSFKYGSFEGERNGRYFTDFDEASFRELITSVPSLTVIDMKLTSDARPGREEEKWLNVILQKSCD